MQVSRRNGQGWAVVGSWDEGNIILMGMDTGNEGRGSSGRTLGA